MITKPAHRTATTLAVTIVLTQLLASNVAQADSAREWGYWDAATAAGSSSVGDDGFSNMTTSQNINTAKNDNTGDNLNSDGQATRFNRGAFETAGTAASTPKGDYVGYNLCYYNCTGTGAHHDGQVAGKFYVSKGAERVAKGSRYESTHLVNGQPHYVQTQKFYDATITGSYQGASFNMNSGTLHEVETVYHYGTEYNYFELNGSDGNVKLSSHMMMFTEISDGNTRGWVQIGKPVAATQIAAQLRLGQTYNFSGHSYRGSSVNVAVNFQKATWNGSWSGPRAGVRHNGFTAAGGISGATLTSQRVNGAGNAGAGFVTGGKVNATLIGAINGTDVSNASIIGSTVVNVQQTNGTKISADLFTARANKTPR